MSRQYCRGRRHTGLREKTIAKLMLIMIINVVAIIEVLDIIMMLIYGMIIETTKFLPLTIETPMTSSWLLRDITRALCRYIKKMSCRVWT